MADPRVERMADLIVNYSTSVKPGDRAFIIAEPPATPLISALYREILKAGGHPHLLMDLPDLEESLIKYGNDEQIGFAPTFLKAAYETFEVRINIQSESNTRQLSGTDKQRFAQRRKAMAPLTRTQMARGAAGELRWITTLFPTQAYAQDAEMSLGEYEDFVFRACHVDDPAADPVAYWRGVEVEMERIVKYLAGKDRVTVRGPNCDLELSIKGRVFRGSDGKHNLPDGEVFTGPVENSVNGWIRYTYPAIWKGNVAEGVELRFVDGRVEQATAARNEEFLLQALGTDAGARYLGEFAVGTNFGVDRFTGNILFDEKIGGTIHLALGAGYPETGSTNTSAIHWDMVCDMRSGSEIVVDGETVYRDGAFLI